MKHSISHPLSPEMAKAAVNAAIQEYTRRFADYHPRANWVNENCARVEFSAKGIRLQGDLIVQPKTIVIDMDVPFLLRPFQSSAVDVIEGEVQKWVAKVQTGSLPVKKP